MVGLRRKITLGLWLCLALGLFVGLGSPVFSESYGIHNHLLVADSDGDGAKGRQHTPDPDHCVYCHSWVGCALVLVAIPDKTITERLLPPTQAPLVPVAFSVRTDDPVYSLSHPRAPPLFLHT